MVVVVDNCIAEACRTGMGIFFSPTGRHWVWGVGIAMGVRVTTMIPISNLQVLLISLLTMSSFCFPDSSWSPTILNLSALVTNIFQNVYSMRFQCVRTESSL